MSRKNIIVIGGGVAGISSALHLCRRGYRVTLIEQRPFLGGRAYSFTKPDAPPLDNGHHVIIGAYRHFRELLTLMDAAPAPLLQPNFTINFRGSYGGQPLAAAFTAASLPAPAHLLGGLLRLPALSAGEKLRTLHLGAALLTGAPPAEQTVTEWLEELGQPARLTDWLLYPLCFAALNREPRAASARLFHNVLRQAFLSDRHGACIGLFSQPLALAYGEPAQRALERAGVRLLLRRRVTALQYRAPRLLSLQLDDGQQISADAFISALPAPALSALHDEKIHHLWPASATWHHLDSSPIVSVYLLYDRPILDTPFAAMIGTTFQWVFDLSHLLNHAPQPWRGRTLVSLTVSDARALLDQEQATLAVLAQRELAGIFPAAAANRPTAVWIIKERRATIDHSPANEKLRPPAATPFNNFWLAGDWTATGLPCTLEGAALSGATAARLVAAEMMENQRNADRPSGVSPTA